MKCFGTVSFRTKEWNVCVCVCVARTRVGLGIFTSCQLCYIFADVELSACSLTTRTTFKFHSFCVYSLTIMHFLCLMMFHPHQTFVHISFII